MHNLLISDPCPPLGIVKVVDSDMVKVMSVGELVSVQNWVLVVLVEEVVLLPLQAVVVLLHIQPCT